MKAKKQTIKLNESQNNINKFSPGNNMIIQQADPQATCVYHESQWKKIGREVVDKSHPIQLYVPSKNSNKMVLAPFYDIRFTQPIQKQTVSLNESQLKQIIRESIKKVLKEGYGSASDETMDLWNKLAGHEVDPLKSIADGYMMIDHAIHDYLSGDEKDPNYKYARAIRHKTHEIEDIAYRWSLQMINRTGLQNFEDYYTEHDPKIRADWGGYMKNWAKKKGFYEDK